MGPIHPLSETKEVMGHWLAHRSADMRSNLTEGEADGSRRVTEDQCHLCTSMGESGRSRMGDSDIPQHTRSAQETVTMKDTDHYLCNPQHCFSHLTSEGIDGLLGLPSLCRPL